MAAPQILSPSQLGQIPQLEGLSIVEEPPSVTLEGISLSEVAMVGTTVRGPADLAVSITDPSQFGAIFGGRNIVGNSGNPDSNVWTALQKKPFGPLQIVRTQAAAAAGASLLLSGSGLIQATSSGSWANQMSVQVASASDGVVSHADILVTAEGNTTPYKSIDFSSWGALQTSLSASQLTWGAFVNDPTKLVVLTPTAATRPANGTAVFMTGGTDGTITDSDYTAPNRGLAVAFAVKTAGVVMTAEYESAAVNSAKLVLLATQEAKGKSCLFAPVSATVSKAAAIADVASYRDDSQVGGRAIYCNNFVNLIDPTSTANGGATVLTTFPTAWMASILSQVDVDIDIGDSATSSCLAGIQGLVQPNLTRQDYIDLRAAGITTLEKQADGTYLFWSGVTTNLNPGLTRICDRREKDFIEGTLTQLNSQVNKKNTLAWRAGVMGNVDAFLSDLESQGRVVDDYSVSNKANTAATRGKGFEYFDLKVKLVNHSNYIVFRMDASTGTVVGS